MGKNLENIIEGRENPQINRLIYSMEYHNNSGFSKEEIGARIKDMIVVSEKFTRDMEEAAESQLIQPLFEGFEKNNNY